MKILGSLIGLLIALFLTVLATATRQVGLLFFYVVVNTAMLQLRILNPGMFEANRLIDFASVIVNGVVLSCLGYVIFNPEP